MPPVIVLALPQNAVHFFTKAMMTFGSFIDGFSACYMKPKHKRKIDERLTNDRNRSESVQVL